MRNLTRSIALAAALTVTALTAPTSVSSQSLGNCLVWCLGSGFPPVTYNVSTTKSDCCFGNFTNHCPAGSTPAARSWNSARC